MSDTLVTLQDHVRTLLGAEFRDRAESAATRAESAADGVDQAVSDAAGVLRDEVTDDLVAQMQARPAMWLWDGQGTWSPPAGAVATDSVLNLATGEIHSIQEAA